MFQITALSLFRLALVLVSLWQAHFFQRWTWMWLVVADFFAHVNLCLCVCHNCWRWGPKFKFTAVEQLRCLLFWGLCLCVCFGVCVFCGGFFLVSFEDPPIQSPRAITRRNWETNPCYHKMVTYVTSELLFVGDCLTSKCNAGTKPGSSLECPNINDVKRMECLPECANGGSCKNGRCVCPPGLSGPACHDGQP